MSHIEIERKFLITKLPDKPALKKIKIRQGYVAREGGNSVRIREKSGLYILSIKAPAEGEISRHEIEYEISKEEGEILFSLAKGSLIEKIREIHEYEGHIWEVDIFEGSNQGLITVEVELKSEDEKIIFPEWIGPEVSHLRKFYNSYLSQNPFQTWGVTYDALRGRLSSS